MKLGDAPTSGILAEIRRFQKQQAKANGRGEFALADDIGNTLLAPLFAEMARREVQS